MKRMMILALILTLLLCGCTEKKTEQTTQTASTEEKHFNIPESPTTSSVPSAQDKVPLSDVEGLGKHLPTTLNPDEIPAPEPVEPETEIADS